eukprot:433344-Pleurochrysis_carterae.AAC.1
MRPALAATANGKRATVRPERGCGRPRTKRVCRPVIDVEFEVSLRPIAHDPITKRVRMHASTSRYTDDRKRRRRRSRAAPVMASACAALHGDVARGPKSNLACAAERIAEYASARSVNQKGARIPHVVQPTAGTHVPATIHSAHACKVTSDGPFMPRRPRWSERQSRESHVSADAPAWESLIARWMPTTMAADTSTTFIASDRYGQPFPGGGSSFAWRRRRRAT